MIALGIDQARRAGWGLADGRTLVRWGIARTARQRADVVELALSLAGCPSNLYVLLEDHGQMRADRLTQHDKRTQRGHGSAWVQRNPLVLGLGLGRALGWWEQALGERGHPESLRDQIDPLAWRRKLGIAGPQAKLIACRLAEPLIGMAHGTLTDDDLAEGIMLTHVAATDGMLREQLRLAKQRADAKARKDVRSQQGLRFDEGE